MNIAFTYNLRHTYPDPNDPKGQLETDFDDPKTIELLIKYLEECGYKVFPVEADEDAYAKLQGLKGKIDLVFNFAEGIYGSSREGHIPAMLEMLQIPFTGSSSCTHSIMFNKLRAKEVMLANGIPTPAYQIFKSHQDPINNGLEFPLFVKPVAQGSSAGITNNSLVFDEASLREQVKFLLHAFKQSCLVEKFLTGREFSVAMLGNPPVILPIIESIHTTLPDGYQAFDSLEVKWVFEEEDGGANHLKCPADLDEKLAEKIKGLCFKVWEAFDIKDWCRVDLRCDENGDPYVLEINSPAGLLPPEVSTSSYFPLAARKNNIQFHDLLKEIINSSLKRYGIKN